MSASSLIHPFRSYYSCSTVRSPHKRLCVHSAQCPVLVHTGCGATCRPLLEPSEVRGHEQFSSLSELVSSSAYLFSFFGGVILISPRSRTHPHVLSATDVVSCYGFRGSNGSTDFEHFSESVSRPTPPSPPWRVPAAMVCPRHWRRGTLVYGLARVTIVGVNLFFPSPPLFLLPLSLSTFPFHLASSLAFGLQEVDPAHKYEFLSQVCTTGQDYELGCFCGASLIAPGWVSCVPHLQQTLLACASKACPKHQRRFGEGAPRARFSWLPLACR